MPTPPDDDWILQRRRAIGRHICDLRMYADLTQEELAERTGLDRKSIHRFETGLSSPRLDHLLLIASALRVPLIELVNA